MLEPKQVIAARESLKENFGSEVRPHLKVYSGRRAFWEDLSYFGRYWPISARKIGFKNYVNMSATLEDNRYHHYCDIKVTVAFAVCYYSSTTSNAYVFCLLHGNLCNSRGIP